MKKYIAVGIASVFLLCVSCFQTIAQNNPIFFGGSGDGYQRQQYNQNSTSGFVFKGGVGDGADRQTYAQSSINSSIYQGGSGDGFSTERYLPMAAANLFAGGTGDGFADSGYAQQYSDVRKGGMGDGNADTGYSQLYVDTRTGGMGDGWASTVLPVTPLPLSLLTFAGEQHDGKHILRWETATEQQTDHFLLERSATTSGFSTLGEVAASGNSATVKAYSYTDEQPLNGNNFYRLKMVDADSRFTYSNVVLLRLLKDKAVLKVYPNPAASILNIELSGKADNKEILIDIYDAAARLVQRKTIRKDDNTFKVDIQSLAAGLYSIRIVDQGEISVVKFVKN